MNPINNDKSHQISRKEKWLQQLLREREKKKKKKKKDRLFSKRVAIWP